MIEKWELLCRSYSLPSLFTNADVDLPVMFLPLVVMYLYFEKHPGAMLGMSRIMQADGCLSMFHCSYLRRFDRVQQPALGFYHPPIQLLFLVLRRSCTRTKP